MEDPRIGDSWRKGPRRVAGCLSWLLLKEGPSQQSFLAWLDKVEKEGSKSRVPGSQTVIWFL